MEEFRDIKGYEGLYQVSNLGRVKSLNYNHTKKEKILKWSKDKDGYLISSLCKEGKHKTFTVHRLVAEAFLDNPHNYPCINHKDENKTNNNVENLEWCTVKYNVNYGTGIQRKVENTDYKEIGRKIAEKQSKTVLQYTKDGEFVKEWVSTAECGRNGFNQSNVVSCCQGKQKSHKGFIWKYKE